MDFSVALLFNYQGFCQMRGKSENLVESKSIREKLETFGKSRKNQEILKIFALTSYCILFVKVTCYIIFYSLKMFYGKIE